MRSTTPGRFGAAAGGDGRRRSWIGRSGCLVWSGRGERKKRPPAGHPDRLPRRRLILVLPLAPVGGALAGLLDDRRGVRRAIGRPGHLSDGRSPFAGILRNGYESETSNSRAGWSNGCATVRVVGRFQANRRHCRFQRHDGGTGAVSRSGPVATIGAERGRLRVLDRHRTRHTSVAEPKTDEARTKPSILVRSLVAPPW